MSYLPRCADLLLKQHLEAFGAVLIEGPKWCGKTTTAQQQAASVLQLQDADEREVAFANAAVRPSLLLEGASPRLIDEWQDIPVLWDAIRTMVDRRGEPGQFILTGSNTIDGSRIMHSGTGRISRLRMYPMSLFESGESSGMISLRNLFDNPRLDIDGVTSPFTIEDLVFAACRGGWPASLSRKTDRARLMIAGSYLDSLCATDISRIDGVRRNSKLMRLILRTYARNLSTLALKSTMLKDVRGNFESCDEKTFEAYLEVLRRLFVIEDMDAWCPAVRSASTMRKSPKREFTDPSLAVTAMGLSPEILMHDMKTFGFIFECMCVRDLRAYSQSLGGLTEYYHDRYGLESDIVLHLNDGRFALFECKLGSADIGTGAEHLLEIRNLIRARNAAEGRELIREPELLIVVTGGKMAYSRPDGVKVIPLACLRD